MSSNQDLRSIIKSESNNANASKETLKNEVLCLIDEYIQEASRRKAIPHTLAFALHVLFRSGEGENHSYSSLVIEDFQWLIEGLSDLLIHPKHSAGLVKQGFDLSDVAKKMSKLRSFFESINEFSTRAELERLDLKYYGEKLTENELRQQKVVFERELEMLRAKEAIYSKHNSNLNQLFRDL